MATLLLRLAAPLQSWGVDSKFETRRTQNYPTKSGVIGMIAAALGISREDDDALKKLSKLKFGVRIDNEGEIIRDYHIAVGEKPYITNRYYLCDAVFIAGIEDDDTEFLKEIEYALKNPVFPLFLGRRSCPPTMPLVLGIRDSELVDSLREEEWQISDKLRKNNTGQLRIITDGSAEDNMSVARDVPVSFSKKHRIFTWRNIRDCGYISKNNDESVVTDHDPFLE